MENNKIENAIGYSIDDDDMHWYVNCPKCDKEYEYSGYFDNSDITECTCGCKFKTDKIYFLDGSYIK